MMTTTEATTNLGTRKGGTRARPFEEFLEMEGKVELRKLEPLWDSLYT